MLLTFEPVDEKLHCDDLNESSLGVLPYSILQNKFDLGRPFR